MGWCRKSRWRTVIFTVLALVLSQAAIAAHACGMARQALEAAAMAQSKMPCAQAMAPSPDEAAALCHTHCQSSQGTVDHPAPQVAELGQASPVLIVQVPPAPHAAAPAPERFLWRATAGPPIAIANCCFRI